MTKIKLYCDECKEITEGYLSVFEYGEKPPEGEQPILLHIKCGGFFDADIECPKCGKLNDVFY